LGILRPEVLSCRAGTALNLDNGCPQIAFDPPRCFDILPQLLELEFALIEQP
jgi:hypothetical protein